MSDLITQLCQLTAEILQKHPHADVARLVGLVKQGIDANSRLGEAIQSDRQLIQINEGNAKGFQTLVTGGIANIGIHLNDVNRETLQEVLHEALGELLKSLQKQIPSNVQIGSTNFVGREKELAEIHAKLQAGQGVSICAVEGMGGLGKSELALQYAWRYRQKYAARYWFFLRGGELAQEVVKLASRTLPLPEAMGAATLDEQAAWYWQNWIPTEGKVLVIFDDVTDLASIPKQARPLADRFQILVTTRKRKLSSQFAEIPLGVISEDEALELLRKLLGKLRVDRELVAAKSICEYLGCLPLAVELAGRYLQLDEDLRLSDYRQRLTIADESLALQESEEINATRGVIAAFELSWQELSAGTAKVAMLLGLFAPADIAWGLVEEIAAQLNIDDGELREGRKQLNNLYLIKSIAEDRSRFAVHSLTRQFLQWKLAQEPDINRLFRETFVMSLLGIAKEIPETPTLDLIARVAPAIPHLDMLSREMLNDIPNPDDDYNLVWAFTGIAWFYQGQGLYALAEVPHQRCLDAVKEKLGDRHPDVATSLNNFAGLYYSQGRYEAAEPLYQKSLEIHKSIYGELHTKIATSLNNLAELYSSQGRYEAAEPLYRQALTLWQELLGDRHSHVAFSLNNLARLHHLQGRYEEAEPLYQQALTLRQELLGDHHPDVATSFNNLAMLHHSQGRYEEAEPLCQQALALWQELLGDRHPHVAFSLNNLAELYRSQGRYEEAEPLYQQALTLWQELLGDRHPHVATGLNNLALLHHSQGRYEEAEPLCQQALALWQELLGDRHPHVAFSLNNLAELYRSQGRYEEAEPFYQQALALRQELLGDRHPDVASSLNNLASLYDSQGKYEEAEPLYQQALALRQELLGDRHPDVASSLNNLASLYDSQGKYEEAEPLYQQALALRQELLGDRHPDVAASFNNLAVLRYNQNRYDEAEALFLQALEILESVLGNNHPNTQSVKESLANLRKNQGKS
ncbi:MAG: tetratricopeptide repeat protein [Pseudanabaena sp.]